MPQTETISAAMVLRLVRLVEHRGFDAKPRKVATSLCLSFHPSTPPTEAQVLELARTTKPAV
jgi:hypothetical protein